MSTDLQICHLRLVLVWWSVVGIFRWQSVFEGGEIVGEEDVVHNAAQIYNSVERNGLLSALYFRRACTDTASSAWTNACLNYLQLDQDVQGGFFKCSSRFSAPKVPSTRATFQEKWKKAPRWLSKFFFPFWYWKSVGAVKRNHPVCISNRTTYLFSCNP